MAKIQLNPRQKEAMLYVDGPLLVLAGAGSGKTGVITRKIAWLARNYCRPDQIAAVTFTNKAAREMKQRASGLLSRDESQGLTVSTFHSLGLQMIRDEHEALQLKPRFSIFDSEDVDKLLADLLGRDSELRKTARFVISGWKAGLISPVAAMQSAKTAVEQRIASAYAEYQRRLRAYNAVDFDDLLALPVQLLRDDEQARERWQNRFRYILVDEYQDTNAAQYELLRHLVGVRAAFTVVGDDDQSIYAWRGARPGNIADLNKHFPHLKVIKLEQNYRSVGYVLSAANHLIKSNTRAYEKSLWSAKGQGDPVRVVASADEYSEAEQVVSEILAHKMRHGTRLGEYAVLYRGNYQSRMFEKSLRERNVAYQVSGGRSFFERSEIRDLAAYMRLMLNNDDDAAFLRIVNLPRRGIGPATLETLGKYAGQRHLSLFNAARGITLTNQLGERSGEQIMEFVNWLSELAMEQDSRPVHVLLETLMRDIGYRDWLRETASNDRAARRRMENINGFLEWIENLEVNKDGTNATLQDVMRKLNLMDYAARSENEADDKVHLLTLHAAKGLEFDYVWLVGMEEGLLPHHACMDDEKIEEERRLLYVGITRARKRLALTYAQRRRRGGEMQETTPSRFLEDLPAEEIVWGTDLKKRQQRADAKTSRENLDALKALLSQDN